MSADELIREVINDSAILTMYADDSDESINKKANIDEFVNSVDEFCRLNKEATLSDFLNQVTLSSDTDDMDESEYVTLATIHSVKGLEFKTVFIVGMEENIMPVSRAAFDESELEEERRLMYVAITRAKERLYLTRSRSRYLYGKREMTLKSRFIGELAPVLDVPPERSLYEEYAKSAAGYRSGSGYTGYGYGRRRFGREENRDEDEFGYRSDIPSSSESRTGGFSAAAGFKATLARASSSDKKDAAALVAGVKVRHPKFGEGMVVSVRGEGAAKVVNVSFAGLGIKSLSAQLAPLTIIEK